MGYKSYAVSKRRSGKHPWQKANASQRAITRQTITSKFSSIKVSSMWKTDASSGYSSGIGTMERDSSRKLSSKGDSFSSLGNTHYQDSHKTPIRKRNSNPSMIS